MALSKIRSSSVTSSGIFFLCVSDIYGFTLLSSMTCCPRSIAVTIITPSSRHTGYCLVHPFPQEPSLETQKNRAATHPGGQIHEKRIWQRLWTSCKSPRPGLEGVFVILIYWKLENARACLDLFRSTQTVWENLVQQGFWPCSTLEDVPEYAYGCFTWRLILLLYISSLFSCYLIDFDIMVYIRTTI